MNTHSAELKDLEYTFLDYDQLMEIASESRRRMTDVPEYTQPYFHTHVDKLTQLVVEGKIAGLNRPVVMREDEKVSRLQEEDARNSARRRP